MTATGAAVRASGQRWAGWAGIAFVVLFVVGTFLVNTPSSDASAAEWQEHFEDSGNRWLAIAHGYLWALAGIAFIVFLGAVRERVRLAADWLGSVVFASGIVYVAMLFIGGIGTAAVAGGIEFGEAPTEGAGEFGRWFEQLGFGALLLFGMFAAGVFVITAAIGLRRAGLVPGWLAVSGDVVGVILILLGVFFIPQILLMLWVLAVSILLLTRSRTAVTP
jgi:hypothetical protein